MYTILAYIGREIYRACKIFPPTLFILVIINAQELHSISRIISRTSRIPSRSSNRLLHGLSVHWWAQCSGHSSVHETLWPFYGWCQETTSCWRDEREQSVVIGLWYTIINYFINVYQIIENKNVKMWSKYINYWKNNLWKNNSNYSWKSFIINFTFSHISIAQ